MVFLKLRILIHHLVTKNEQIVENMKALDVIPLLTPEVVDKIEAVVQSKPKRTESYRWSGTGGVQSVLQGFQDLPGGILLDDIIIFHCLMFGSCFMCLGLCSWEMVSSGTLLYIHFVMWTTHLLLSVIYIPWSFPCASIHPFPAFLAGIFSDSLVSCAWTVPASSFLVTLFSCHCLPASIKDSAERVRVPRNQECFYHGPCWFFSLARFQWQAGHHVSWHAVLRNQSVSVHLGEDDSTTTTLCRCVSHISSGSEWWVVVSMRMCCCLQESSAFTGAKIGGKNEAGEVVWLLCCLAGRGNGGWHAFVRIRERIRNPGGSLFSVAGHTKTAKTANKVWAISIQAKHTHKQASFTLHFFCLRMMLNRWWCHMAQYSNCDKVLFSEQHKTFFFHHTY